MQKAYGAGKMNGSDKGATNNNRKNKSHNNDTKHEIIVT